MPIELHDYLEKTWAHNRNVDHQLKFTILAAGLGKRMEPLTQNHLPKPMFPLGGSVPMMETWVRKAVDAGITDISMNLCVLKDTIKNYFRDGAIFGSNITYVEEDQPSGTFGGICKLALGRDAKQVFDNETMPTIPAFGGATIIAPSGDIVTNFGADLIQQMYMIHRQKGAAMTMLLSPIAPERRGEFGTVELEAPEQLPGEISESGRIKRFLEKDPNSPSILNNASLYMIEMDLIKTLDGRRTAVNGEKPEPFYDFGKHVFPAVLGKLPYAKLPKDFILWGISYDGLWYDVGRKRDYLQINQALLDGHTRVELPYLKLPWGYLGANVVADFSEITIVPPVIIGNDCIIEPGAKLGPYAIIGDGWRIEQGVEIRNSVLWKRYAFFTSHGRRIPVRERKLVDRHEVRRGTVIDECIIVGGTIDPNVYDPGQDRLHEKTVGILENGELQTMPIDWVPAGPRA
jgi:mannose-1-phosphate guanylyltransferase/phosphomannomutase